MEIRRSLVDGIYYPEDPEALKDMVKSLLAAAPDLQNPPPAGLLGPHGAYEFTGRYLAEAYKRCRGLNPETVLILAPIHRPVSGNLQAAGFAGELIALPPGDAFETPMGKIEIDQALTEMLLQYPGFCRDETPYLEEPAVECQLPFVQFLFPQAKVLPIYYGEASPKNRKRLSLGLEALPAGKVFPVITSNLSAFLPAPQSLIQAENFLEALSPARRPFRPEEYVKQPSGRGICGLPCLAAWWAAAEKDGRPELELCAWGPDLPLPEDMETTQEKRIFYGAFVIKKGGKEDGV